MSKPKKTPAPAATGEVRGRALVDIPGLARCGEFIVVDAEVALQLEAAGQFDPRAVEAKE